MKSITLTYSRDFVSSPMTGWEGPPKRINVQNGTINGQFRNPETIKNPYFRSRKKWCLLGIVLDGVELQFSGPDEFDAFVQVMKTDPLPTSKTLQKQAQGDAEFHNGHWLSRLPAKAKTPKFAAAFLKYIGSEPTELKEWRAFFQTGGSPQ